MKFIDHKSTRSRLALNCAEWITSQSTRSNGGFPLSPQSPVCLIGSCCAVLASEILGSLSCWSSQQIRTVAQYIHRFQRDDGWFEDPYLRRVDGNKLDSRYFRGHATFLAVMALDALGQQPDRRLAFLDQWRDDTYLYDWIDQRDWTKPWRESNWVEWIGYWLLVDAQFTVDDVPLQKEQYPPGFAGLMQWLEDFQDATTGFWGNPPYQGQKRVLHQMAAAYHHYVFYYATGHPLRYMNRIVDHTLLLQQPDGLFSLGVGGGPCEDLNAIDILANMHRLADYRRSEIEEALSRAVLALLKNQRSNGAFVFAIDAGALNLLPSILKTVFRPWVRPGPLARIRAVRRYIESAGSSGLQQYYGGCHHLPFRRKEGDMFSQWFRPLAIAIAANVLGPSHSPILWNFGFRRQVTQGWWPGQRQVTASGRAGVSREEKKLVGLSDK